MPEVKIKLKHFVTKASDIKKTTIITDTAGMSKDQIAHILNRADLSIKEKEQITAYGILPDRVLKELNN